MTPGPPPAGEPLGRPGRKLGPISDGVGPAHRAWLEPLRLAFLSSGKTIGELSERTLYAKSKLSELLRGAGLYPRWEITHGLLTVLDMPTWPMRRLWAAAAVEAHKKPEWITGSMQTVVLTTGPGASPLDHQGFVELNRPAYRAYADIFLRVPHQAQRVVAETFDILWLRWKEALASVDVQKFAWRVHRRGVMTRTPHIDGYPELVSNAFDTVVLSETSDDARFDQIAESMGLFQAMSRLPDMQLDVMALKYMRQMPDALIADALGVPVASVIAADHYAKRSLTEVLDPHSPEEKSQ